MLIEEITLSYFELLEKLTLFADTFNYFSIHCSNQHPSKHQIVAGFGVKKMFNSFEEISLYDSQWKFGFVSYDLKNKLEKLNSRHPNVHQLPEISFFVPEIIIRYQEKKLEIIAENEAEEKVIRDKIIKATAQNFKKNSVILEAQTSKEQYLQAIKDIKQKIQLGDIYEINYCINFFNTHAVVNCNDLFIELNKISEAPFACYTRHGEHYVISSSPERFIQKQSNRLSTEPIKGTAARGRTQQEEEEVKNELFLNPKERNENVMIVDVSRNDLSRLATKGSVKVDELFKVKTYKQVHQLVSTVSCELKPDTSFQSVFNACFPPASMTGAPKIKAMQLIDEYENFRRGIYSGSIGFIEPNGDFDFNVVIRSIVYNSKTKYISYSVGSAITAKCDAEKEYDECLLKARAMKEILEK